MKPRTRCARIGALVAALAVAAAACSSDREAVSAPPFGTGTVAVSGDVPPTLSSSPVGAVDEVSVDLLAMVGDSITVGASAALQEGFATIGLEGDAVDIDAESGRRMVQGGRISSGLSAIEGITSTDRPDLWVIALGTNDVANYRPEEYAREIGRLLAAVPADAPIVWVDTYLANYEEQSSTFNDVLRQVLAERGRATVVDWSSVAGDDGLLTDGVHPSGAGNEELTRRVVDAVEAWTA